MREQGKNSVVGKLLTPAGFEIEHTGGGIYLWHKATSETAISCTCQAVTATLARRSTKRLASASTPADGEQVGWYQAIDLHDALLEGRAMRARRFRLHQKISLQLGVRHEQRKPKRNGSASFPTFRPPTCPPSRRVSRITRGITTSARRSMPRTWASRSGSTTPTARSARCRVTRRASRSCGRTIPRTTTGAMIIETEEWSEILTAIKIRCTEYCHEIGRA